MSGQRPTVAGGGTSKTWQSRRGWALLGLLGGSWAVRTTQKRWWAVPWGGQLHAAVAQSCMLIC